MVAGDLSGLTVLVIDDQEFVVQHTRRILNRLGITRVHAAGSGESALELLDTAVDKPHLILCDINMPDMDGVALLRHLGMRVSMYEMKFGLIFVSGVDERILATVETLGRSHHLYVLGSIQKPVRSQALLELLQHFDPEHVEPQRASVQPITQEELLEGIGTDRVRLFYQPKVAISDGSFVGVEALARWQHPQRGLLGPDTFIPLAEELGQIDTLTENVIRQALAQCARWQSAGERIRVAVNYSVDSLVDLIQPEFISNVAREYGVPEELLTIEMTETLVMHDAAVIIEVLTRMRLHGVGLSLDDFGTGHATLERLQQIPFTELKLDKSYVAGARSDPRARTILESSVALGRGLGLKLVAEGVEDQACWDIVRELGCDVAQGFLIARPMPGDELLQWLRDWRARSDAAG